MKEHTLSNKKTFWVCTFFLKSSQSLYKANVSCKIPSHCHFRLVQPLLNHGKVCRIGTGGMTCQMRLPDESHGMCWTNSHFTQSPVEQRPPRGRTNNFNSDRLIAHSVLEQFAQLDITPLRESCSIDWSRPPGEKPGLTSIQACARIKSFKDGEMGCNSSLAEQKSW